MTQSSAKVKPITCGFYDCMWKFEGLRSTDGFALSSTWKDASGEKYHRFNADESSGSVEWESLLIVARAGAGPKNAEKVEVADPGQTSSGKLKDPCPICWTTLESSNEGAITTTTCGHTFHTQCVDTWSSHYCARDSLSSCPLCRRSL
ncbi:hypothetical protein PHYSODRAFT_299570 [Phytophthora sojae]|uniref:RING-type domain-containing protein n=1 Tax=Phytophthora sojae (strain P6497) TaxID=1094619 RepID=G4ZCB8_PHYSP|nr:hypothetical protein PHYSODRAFT_299570 [Phytophthora sojae]EGZ22146.1 hypothetical protein PHYSODRAFT_299570 [Phytophthora sojae]|eukprot:XP_009524863.1 hypothetical protein PHYSODRAFT_299570 [Phytophthora sojae]